MTIVKTGGINQVVGCEDCINNRMTDKNGSTDNKRLNKNDLEDLI